MDATSPLSGQGVSHLAATYSGIRTAVLAEAAEKLGLSLDQLRSELAAGTPLAQIAVAGVTRSSDFVLTKDEPSSLVDLTL